VWKKKKEHQHTRAQLIEQGKKTESNLTQGEDGGDEKAREGESTLGKLSSTMDRVASCNLLQVSQKYWLLSVSCSSPKKLRRESSMVFASYNQITTQTRAGGNRTEEEEVSARRAIAYSAMPSPVQELHLEIELEL
jgi:hypothetical protein